MKDVKNLFNKMALYRIFLLFIFQLIIVIFFVIIKSDYWDLIIFLSVVSFFGSAIIIYSFSKSPVINSGDREQTSLNNTFLIANETLPHLRQGLNEESAVVIAEVIKNICDVAAVAITDTQKVLAFIGTGCEKHPVGKPIVTNATRNVIQSGMSKIIKSKEGFNCQDINCICPLESAVIVPLFNKEKVVGTLKLYQTEKGHIPNYIVKLAHGLAQILSMQIDLVDLEHQAQLKTEAQLDALQAQINPHFLFNTLNTIKMYILKDPDYARDLLVRLSKLLRYLLGSYGRYITLEEEIKYIEDYVIIEKARFIDKLKVEMNIDDDTKDCQIPVFSIQPLVNNAILHGILPMETGGIIKIDAHINNNELVIKIEDNGIGIPQDKIKKIFEPRYGSGCGVGIPNVNERLKILYGIEYELKIESVYNKGTKVWFKIPYTKINDKQVISCN